MSPKERVSALCDRYGIPVPPNGDFKIRVNCPLTKAWADSSRDISFHDFVYEELQQVG